VKFCMSTNIERAWGRDEFLGYLVYGTQRLGKSSYALQVLYDLYGSWELALENMVFELKDLVTRLEKAHHERTKLKALCWDDAGVFGSRYLYFSDRNLVMHLQSLFDVVGISAASLILTTPNPLGLLRVVRTYEWARVKVYKRDQYNGRTAVGYASSMLPSGMRLIHREWSDRFNVLLPDEVYETYMVRRRSYLDVALARLKEVTDKAYPGDGHEPGSEVDEMGDNDNEELQIGARN
jgi:hypothetical protein